MLVCLCWMISLGIYFICDPTTILWTSMSTGRAYTAADMMWLFFFAGGLVIAIRFSKWWLEKPKF